MSIWSGKRKHLDHHFWTKSDKISPPWVHLSPFPSVTVKSQAFSMVFVLGSRFGGATLQKVRKRKATDTVWPFLRFCHFWSKSDGQNDYVLHYFSTCDHFVIFASQKYDFSLGKFNVLRKWNFHFCTCRFGVGIVSWIQCFSEAEMTKWPQVEK